MPSASTGVGLAVSPPSGLNVGRLVRRPPPKLRRVGLGVGVGRVPLLVDNSSVTAMEESVGGCDGLSVNGDSLGK